ncbi:MAG: selenide, water dikinase SelD, partial [Burkholderiales bacterium]|nr:selenide, water dikinase SelD [Burkholderiales bacterium]
TLLSDPQTSGGLLVACDAGSVELVLEIFRSGDFLDASVIGDIVAGTSIVEVNL